MSKISNLDLVLDEMITAGQKMIEAATALKEIFSATAEPEKSTDTPAEEAALKSEIKKYSFQEVRGIMASLSGKGKKAEAKALLTKYGATRLSEVKEEDYAALVADAEVMLNG